MIMKLLPRDSVELYLILDMFIHASKLSRSLTPSLVHLYSLGCLSCPIAQVFVWVAPEFLVVERLSGDVKQPH